MYAYLRPVSILYKVYWFVKGTLYSVGQFQLFHHDLHFLSIRGGCRDKVQSLLSTFHINKSLRFVYRAYLGILDLGWCIGMVVCHCVFCW